MSTNKQDTITPTPKAKDLHLPVSRVKTIMKSSPEVDSVGLEPLFLVTKVTELFVIDLAKRAFRKCPKNTLEYKQIAEIVQKDDTLDFLREIMPCKITVKQYKELMAARAAKRGESSSSDEESGDEETTESDASK